LDAVRCITNASTGELGVLLAECLASAGWEVICFKGRGAVFRGPFSKQTHVHPFFTNQDLLDGLRGVRDAGRVAAVFHAAALCDYELAAVETSDGVRLERFAKIPGSYLELRLTLQPAPRLLPLLRRLFPTARIVAWKLEWEGDRLLALEKGGKQLSRGEADLTVVNGPAYGSGFGVLDRLGGCEHLDSKPALCEWMAQRSVDWQGR
jgi:phosphopantothenoylcysteine decarboxylase/phosphopantothenate--cysteine ligase